MSKVVRNFFNKPGRKERLYLDIYNILIEPFLKYFGKQAKTSEYRFLDDVFHASARSFEYLKVNEDFDIRLQQVQGSRAIPGLKKFIAKKGDILLLRRDAVLDTIEIAILDLDKEEETYRISIYDLQYIAARSEIVDERTST